MLVEALGKQAEIPVARTHPALAAEVARIVWEGWASLVYSEAEVEAMPALRIDSTAVAA